MEPRYSFCTSADGTRLAYAVYGNGPPLLYLPTSFLSMDARFTIPEARAFLDALALRTTLVTYDRRGCGASMRDVADLSSDAEERDIATVADAAGHRDFTLFAETPYDFISPKERILRVILWQPFDAVSRLEVARTSREDWSLARRVWAGRVWPEGPVSLQRAFSDGVKRSVSAEMFARRWEEVSLEASFDARLPDLTMPALVLAREKMLGLRPSTVRVASLVPNGELRFVGGAAGFPYPGHEPVEEAVFGFMGLSSPASVQQPPAMAIILFADIADSTALTERLGDVAFREKARELDEALRRAIASNGGTAIDGKLLGDGVLATFGAAREAIACAAAIHTAGGHAGLPLHVGVHAGDVIREEGNVYGGAVNIAARIADASAAGETLLSQTVRDLARTSAGVTFEDRGERELKGVSEPVRVFAVRAALRSEG